MKALSTDFVDLRVFIEGVRMEYVTAVTVTSNGQTTSATISIPSSPLIRTETLTGAMVHIFYMTSESEVDCTVKNKNADVSDWPILFQGEVRGTSHTAGINSTSTVIRCVTHGRHFQQTLVHFVDPAKASAQSVGVLRDRIEFIGNARYVFQDSSTTVGTYPSRMLNSIEERMNVAVNGNLENIGFVSIINEILYAGSASAAYKIFQKKLRLNSRVSAFIDPDVKKLVSMQDFKDLIDNKIRKMPIETSLHQLMGVCSGLLKYDWLHISQPRYIKDRVVVTSSTRSSGIFNSEDSLKAIKLNNIEYVSYNSNGKPEVKKGLAVEFPVDWTDQVLQKLAFITTDLRERTQLMAQSRKPGQTLIGVNSSPVTLPNAYFDPTTFHTRGLTITEPAFIRRVIEYASSKEGRSSSLIDEGIRETLKDYKYVAPLPESESGKSFKDNLSDNLSSQAEFVNIERDFSDFNYIPIDNFSQFKRTGDLSHLDSPERRASSATEKKDQWSELQDMLQREINDRSNGLAEFVAIPNIDFSQPPRCNVITPIGINNFGIQIDHFSAPTRLYGLASILDNTKNRLPKWYIAPLSVYYKVSQDTGLPAVWVNAYKETAKKDGRYISFKDIKPADKLKKSE